MTTKNRVLEFWFGVLEKPSDFPKERFKLWFVKDPEFDQKIEEEFGDLLKSNLDHWCSTPKGRLAHIIVFDQFSRNIYRNSSLAFMHDLGTADLTLEGILLDMDKALFPVERGFFYMPLQHSEDLKVQEQSLEAYSQLVDESPEEVKPFCSEFLKSARLHHKIISRFGRFPHRNEVLGRLSTPEEQVFLKEPNSSF